MADQSSAKAHILLSPSGADAMLEPLRSYGHDVVLTDLFCPPTVQTRVLLRSVEIVLLDVTAATREVLGAIHSLTAVIAMCDVVPQILCFSMAQRNAHFVLAIERCGARYTRVHDAAMLLEALDLLMADMADIRRNRPCFHVLHRFTLGSCAPGEEVSAVLFPRAGADPQLRLALSERLTFDYLVQHRRIALDARQIASGLNGDWFYRNHATNSGMIQRVKIRVPTIKVVVGRIRVAMAMKFAEAHLRIDPLDVLQSRLVVGNNRILYRLNADVHFIHSDV